MTTERKNPDHRFIAHANPDRNPSCVRCGRPREHPVHDKPIPLRAEAVVESLRREIGEYREKIALYERIIHDLREQLAACERES